MQALGAAFEIALAHLADDLQRSADPARDRSIGDAFRTGETMRAHSRGMGHGGGVGDHLQLDAVGLVDHARGEFSSMSHGNLRTPQLKSLGRDLQGPMVDLVAESNWTNRPRPHFAGPVGSSAVMGHTDRMSSGA